MLIKPVNPKGNQPWTFIGRTDAEAEAPILWPPDAKSWLTGKDPDVGKDWRQEEKGDDRGWDAWMASSTQWSKICKTVRDREAWYAAVHGVTAKSWTWLSNWTTTVVFNCRAKWFHIHIYTYYFPDSFPLQVITKCWVWFCLLHSSPCWLSILYIVVCVRWVYTQYVLDKSGDFLEPHCPLSVQWLWMMTTVYMPSILHKAV